ncbi:MAG: hypothetical protein KTQ49_02790 [Candidatus Omnitrophica bacterium]|nr:hypothetical protein [Candidatus Omnitrophota bacterium]
MREIKGYFVKIGALLRGPRTWGALLGLVFVVGFWARFFQMTGHFAHTDDLGMVEQLFRGQAEGNIFFVPQYLTNAPLQYLLTFFLVSPSMEYLDILFWGRLPSCVAGCLALVTLFFFYREYDKTAAAKAFFALALVACSWENIAFAKQMHSYAIGVLAAAIVLLLFVRQLRETTFPLKQAALVAGGLALASHMQYQALLFIPAFYVALFLHLLGAPQKTGGLRGWLMSGVLYLLLVFPMWYFFLRHQFGGFAVNTQWALGASGQYGLDPALFRDLGANGLTILKFYLKNLFVIFEAKTGFFPQAAPFFKAFSIGLFSLFLFGTVNFFMSSDKKHRFLGLFFGLVLLTWWIMVPLKQLPYGPSRHTLILLPFFAVTVAEGAEGISGVLRRWRRREIPAIWQQRVLIGLGLLVILLFLAYYGTFLKERKNPLVEEEICRTLEAYDIDEVFYDARGFHLEYMKGFGRLYQKIKQKRIKEVATFAFITRYPFPSIKDRCEAYQHAYNIVALRDYMPRSGDPEPVLIRRPCSDFHVVYEKRVESDVTETFSRDIKINILTNRLFFYILSVDPEKKAIAQTPQGSHT